MTEPASPLARLSLGTSGLVATVSASTLIVSSVPKLVNFLGSGEIDYYDKFIREPILVHLFGVDYDLPWSSGYLDALALWLSLFVAVNAFVYREEGVLLWGHIRRNYCGRSATNLSGTGFCTLAKISLAFIATPLACLHIAAMSLTNRSQTLFTSAYITLNPSELASYLKHLGLAVTALVVLLWVCAKFL
jgi:hypothetical protein